MGSLVNSALGIEQHAERGFCHHLSHPSVLDSGVPKTD